MHLSEFAQRFRHDRADILIVNEEVARLGRYSDFFYSFCILNGELYSIHVAYSMLPYYKMNTREFHQDKIFLTRYKQEGADYRISEQVEIGGGEDPRVVSNGKQAYAIIIANKFSGERTLLFDLVSRQLLPLKVDCPNFAYGKNWQPLMIGDDLFIVHELVPYRLLKVDVKTGRANVVREIDIDFKLPCFRSPYPMFRGGSNAIAIGDKVFGLGRGTSERYRHHPFFWSMDGTGHLEITFTNFFDPFYRCGYNIIDPTSLFVVGDDLLFGLCCTERDWAHTQLLTNFLIALRPSAQGVKGRGLTEFFSARNNQTSDREPNLDRHLFFCTDMPCAVASENEFGGRVSLGKAGHLVHGPYVRAPSPGTYVAELTYLTKSVPKKRAGLFDVAVTWPEGSSHQAGLRTLVSADLEATDGAVRHVALQFDTFDLQGALLEFRVHADEGVIMNAYHIRTWRETNGHRVDQEHWCGFKLLNGKAVIEEAREVSEKAPGQDRVMTRRKFIHCTDGHNLPPRPGLGYMIFALAEAFLYAYLTKRTLIVDWRDTEYLRSTNVNLFSELFEGGAFLGVPIQTEGIDETLQGRSRFIVDARCYKRLIARWEERKEDDWAMFWNDLARLTGRLVDTPSDGGPARGDAELPGLSNFPLKFIDDDVIATPFVGAVLSYTSKSNSITDRFIRQLALRKEYREIVEEFRRTNFGGKCVVGMHIRHGNGEKGDFLQKRRQIADVGSLLDRIEQAVGEATKAPLAETSVFLCTDSDVVVAEAQKRIPRLITRPQWRPQAGAGCSLQLGHLCPGGEIENAANAAIDMFLLGSCDYLVRVGEGSWFTKVAARLVGSERTIFVDAAAPDIDNHVFACGNLPAAVEWNGIGRASVGKGGHLIYGPYLRIDKEDAYCAELQYQTTSCPGSRAGAFEVVVSRRHENGGHVEFRTLGSAELGSTAGKMQTARIAFDTTGAKGLFLELRVHVEQDVLMNTFHIRTRRLGNAGRQIAPTHWRKWRELARRNAVPTEWAGGHGRPTRS